MESTRESEVFERSHRPYASMNWIRFNGSLRPQSAKPYCSAVSQPLAGTPLVNAGRLCSCFGFCQPCNDDCIFPRASAWRIGESTI